METKIELTIITEQELTSLQQEEVFAIYASRMQGYLVKMSDIGNYKCSAKLIKPENRQLTTEVKN